MRFIYSKVFIWFFAIVCLSTIIFAVRNTGLFGRVEKFFLLLPRPIIVGARSVVYPITGFVKHIYTVRSVILENAMLQNRVNSLEQQVAALASSKQENEVLKKELGFIQKPPYALQPCTVLAQDPEGVTNTMVLNCGTVLGVRTGQAVVSQGYLVGKVLVASEQTSTVKIISDPDLSIDAIVQTNTVTGVVKGSFSSGVFMDLISQNAEVHSGDLIVTAGINDLIPKNILVGEVGDTVSSANDLFKKVTVHSPINFKNLDYVFVVK